MCRDSFGWNYPPGAEYDKSAPYNQRDSNEDEDFEDTVDSDSDSDDDEDREDEESDIAYEAARDNAFEQQCMDEFWDEKERGEHD